MTNKFVVILKSLKVPKIKKVLLNETKFLVPNYSSLQNPWLGGYCPQVPVLSVLCPQLNLLKPPPQQNSWVRHCTGTLLPSPIHWVMYSRQFLCLVSEEAGCKCREEYTVYSIQYTVYSILYTVYCIQYTVYCIQYTVYSVQYTVYSIQYTVYCILYIG